ncbi:TPA: DUF2502 domain-containing protein, partial [Klebsiella aerogenes]|nr:DUF2502 domain-containing protein [Klebsiella aerogenes]HDG1142212.1 DUF2502 domain-containing protein [Klebsiella aerogenes]
MRKILLLAAVLLASSAPIVTQAEEITLLPAIKLQIGDRDSYGHYWDGGRWRDKDYWHRHYEYRDKHWRKLEKKQRKAYEKGYRDGRKDYKKREKEYN